MTPDTGPIHWFDWLPPEGFKILLVLFLSFLVGLEREEHKGSDVRYGFGGVRTFPIIGLIGYAIALLSGGELLPVGLGLLAVAGFLLLSYWHKLVGPGVAGITSEMSALMVYLMGALVSHDLIRDLHHANRLEVRLVDVALCVGVVCRQRRHQACGLPSAAGACCRGL